MARVLLFIPAYNCEKQVVRVLDQLDEGVRPWISRVLVVNNRSTDGTEQAVQDWMVRHPEVPLVLLRNDANYSLGGSRTRGDTFLPLFVDPADAGFDEVPGLPAHRANAGLRYRLPKGIGIGLFAQAVSRQKVVYNNNTLYNTAMRVRTQPGYVRFDLEVRVPLLAKVEADAFCRNLFDADYQERFGFPVAGRTVGLSLKTRF